MRNTILSIVTLLVLLTSAFAESSDNYCNLVDQQVRDSILEEVSTGLTSPQLAQKLTSQGCSADQIIHNIRLVDEESLSIMMRVIDGKADKFVGDKRLKSNKRYKDILRAALDELLPPISFDLNEP